MNGKYIRGKVDILSLFGVGFLVLTLITIVSVTSNPLKTQLIGTYAKAKKDRSCADLGSPSARQACRDASEVTSEEIVADQAYRNAHKDQYPATDASGNHLSNEQQIQILTSFASTANPTEEQKKDVASICASTSGDCSGDIRNNFALTALDNFYSDNTVIDQVNQAYVAQVAQQTASQPQTQSQPASSAPDCLSKCVASGTPTSVCGTICGGNVSNTSVAPDCISKCVANGVSVSTCGSMCSANVNTEVGSTAPASTSPITTPVTQNTTSTSTSLEKTDEGFIRTTTTITRDPSGTIVAAKSVSTTSQTTSTFTQTDAGLVRSDTTVTKEVGTGQIVSTTTSQVTLPKTVAIPTASISINPQGTISIKQPSGSICTYSSDCDSGSCQNVGGSLVKICQTTINQEPQLQSQAKAIVETPKYASKAECQQDFRSKGIIPGGTSGGYAVCNTYVNQAEQIQALDVVTLGGFSPYLEANQQANQGQTPYELAGFATSGDYVRDCINKGNPAYGCMRQATNLTPEQVTSAVRLGGTLTTEGALLAGAPAVFAGAAEAGVPVTTYIGVQAQTLVSTTFAGLPAWTAPALTTGALVGTTVPFAINQTRQCGYAGQNFDTAECQEANEQAIMVAAGLQGELIVNADLATATRLSENRIASQAVKEAVAGERIASTLELDQLALLETNAQKSLTGTELVATSTRVAEDDALAALNAKFEANLAGESFSNVSKASAFGNQSAPLVVFEQNRFLPSGQDISLKIGEQTYNPATLEEAELIISNSTGRAATIDSSGVVTFTTSDVASEIPTAADLSGTNAVQARKGLIADARDQIKEEGFWNWLTGKNLETPIAKTPSVVQEPPKVQLPNSLNPSQEEIAAARRETEAIINDPAFQRIKARAEILKAANEARVSALTPEEIAAARIRSEYTSKISEEMTAIQRDLGRATREARANGLPPPRLQYDKLSEVVMSLPNESTSFTIDNIATTAKRYDYTGDLGELEVFFDINGGTATRREILDFVVDTEINPIRLSTIDSPFAAEQTAPIALAEDLQNLPESAIHKNVSQAVAEGRSPVVFDDRGSVITIDNGNPLGGGGQSTVYAGTYNNGQPVAVKIPLNTTSQSAIEHEFDLIQTLRQDLIAADRADLLDRIISPISKISVTQGGQTVDGYVMPQFTGNTLNDYLAGGAKGLGEEDIQAFREMMQIWDRKGHSFGDLFPTNIVKENGKWMLFDPAPPQLTGTTGLSRNIDLVEGKLPATIVDSGNINIHTDTDGVQFALYHVDLNNEKALDNLINTYGIGSTAGTTSEPVTGINSTAWQNFTSFLKTSSGRLTVTATVGLVGEAVLSNIAVRNIVNRLPDVVNSVINWWQNLPFNKAVSPDISSVVPLSPTTQPINTQVATVVPPTQPPPTKVEVKSLDTPVSSKDLFGGNAKYTQYVASRFNDITYHVVTFDLTGVKFLVDSPTRRTTTSDFLNNNKNLDIAINGDGWIRYTDDYGVARFKTVGYSISNGIASQNYDKSAGEGILYFDSNNQMQIVYSPNKIPSDVNNAIGFPNALIVNGVIQSHPDKTDTNPRTALGQTVDGQIIIVDVQGIEYASGMKVDDLSKLMQELGAVTAVMFDGGTSSTLAIAGQPVIANCGGGTECQTANHLGFDLP